MGYQLLDEVEGDCLRATETKHPTRKYDLSVQNSDMYTARETQSKRMTSLTKSGLNRVFLKSWAKTREM